MIREGHVQKTQTGFWPRLNIDTLCYFFISIADLPFSMKKNHTYSKARVTKLQKSEIPIFKLFVKYSLTNSNKRSDKKSNECIFSEMIKNVITA